MINWPHFNIFVSQGRGRPEERVRLGGWQSEHTQHLWIMFTVFYGRSLRHLRTTTIVTAISSQSSLITDRHNKHNNKEKFEIL